jgi:oxygen-dependent protoporphyrinogen oxidase
MSAYGNPLPIYKGNNLVRVAIAGGGISGLSLAWLLKERAPNLDVRVFEAASRTGGKIWTESAEGYLLEGGVNGFLNNRPRTLELAAMLGLSPLSSSHDARRRFLYLRGALRQLPETPGAFLKSDIMSAGGKLRLALELFTPSAKNEDETLASFARRRIGNEAFQTLIDPMASGIYAGDPALLSVRSCFPKVYNLETMYGGLIRGMINMKLQSRKTKKTVTAGPGGVLTSFAPGMRGLTDELEQRLGAAVTKGARAAAIDRSNGRYIMSFDGADDFEADVAVLAAPAFASSAIVQPLDVELSEILARIPYPALSVVCLGFLREQITQNVNSFGFLVPHNEGRHILGALFDSSIFPGRAPEGRVLMRAMIGGARASEKALESDDRLVDTVLSELGRIVGIKGDPEFVRVFKHEKAIPQYNVGHAALLKRISAALVRHNGLYLHGNSYEGIGVNDCIESSFRLSEIIMEKLAQKMAI